jgi:hypothetical protein
MMVHQSYIGLLADRKRKDLQQLKGPGALLQTTSHKSTGRKWRLFRWW